MDEFDRLINETMRTIFMQEPIEEATITADVTPILKAPEETPEQRDERLKREDYARRNAEAVKDREDYARRNAEAVKDREDILRRNKVIGPDETLDMDTEAAIRQRCCF